jgi:hypothetical protein
MCASWNATASNWRRAYGDHIARAAGASRQPSRRPASAYIQVRRVSWRLCLGRMDCSHPHFGCHPPRSYRMVEPPELVGIIWRGPVRRLFAAGRESGEPGTWGTLALLHGPDEVRTICRRSRVQGRRLSSFR